MTIQSDLITALAVVALDATGQAKVFPEAAEQDTLLPLVIYKRINSEPLMTLAGYGGLTKSTFVFECWGATRSSSLDTAAEVIVAIDAATGLTIKFRETVSGEDYESASDQYVEPVSYSFWHV